MSAVNVWLEVAHGDATEPILFEIGHVLTKPLWRRVDPRMGDIRHAVKLNYNCLTVRGAGGNALEMVERPIRVCVGRGRDEQRMVARGIVGCANLELAVGNFRLSAAASVFVAQVGEALRGFRSERIAAVGEAGRARDLWLGLVQRAVNQIQ